MASFNVRWGYDLENRAFDLVSACRELDADVIALQEVWEPTAQPGEARRAADALGYSYFEVPLSGSNVRAEPRITRRPHEIDGWWGLALLSRLPVLHAEGADLGRRAGAIDLSHRRTLEAVIDAGRPVALSVVHLSFVAPAALAQLHRLRSRAVRGGPPGIVAGDFNLPASVVTPAMRGWRAAVKGRTFPARRPRAQLDHIFVTGGAEVVGGSVLASLGSDHRPVRAVLDVVPFSGSGGPGPAPR